MPFHCETCGKCYPQKRNLTRHIHEKHEKIEYWNCVIKGCTSMFIHSSLAKHVNIHHGNDKVTARKCAINATRGDQPPVSSYYEDISEDGSILDLIAEADNIPYDQYFDNCVSSFDLNGLHRDEQTKNAGSKIDYKMDSVADDDTGYNFDDYLDVAEEVAISVDEARDDSTGGGSVSVTSEPKNAEEVVISVDEALDDSNGSDSVSVNSEPKMKVVIMVIILEKIMILVIFVMILFLRKQGDSDFSDNDDGQGGDDGHGIDTSDTEDSDVILISDTDEQAVAILDETVLIQTYIITIKKRTRYINGGVMDAQVQVERGYYQHNE